MLAATQRNTKIGFGDESTLAEDQSVYTVHTTHGGRCVLNSI